MTCFICNGVLEILGTMGNLVHYRCSCCGMQFSERVH
jgi:hypothetical protein